MEEFWCWIELTYFFQGHIFPGETLILGASKISTISDKIFCKSIKQNWTRPENFDIYFCVSFDAIAKNGFMRGRQGTGLSIFSDFWFPNFQRSKSSVFRQLVNRVYSTYRFTCDELNFHGNTLNCKNIISVIVVVE